MKSNTPTLLLSASLLLFPALAASASVESTIDLNVLCRFQRSVTSSGSSDYGRVTTVRITSKDLIVQIARVLNRNFPDGVKLKAELDGRVFVTESDGTVIVEVSKYIQAKMASHKRLFEGKVDNETGIEDTRSYFPVGLTFRFPDLKGSVEGIGVENFHVSSPNNVGVQIAAGDIDSDVNGRGSYQGKTAYYIGTLEFNGRKAVVAD